MKKAAATLPKKHSQGRPKGSKNKPKALKTNIKNNTSTNMNTKELRPSKDLKSAKEPKSVKVKPEVKL
jgi:hypothetical protein